MPPVQIHCFIALLGVWIRFSMKRCPKLMSSATGEKVSSHFTLGWSFKLNGRADPLNLDGIPAMAIAKSPRNNVMVKRALIATFYVLLLVLLMALGSIYLYRRVMQFEHLED